MWIVLSFWLLLPLPGLALLRKLDRESLECGVLSLLARSTVASLVLLTPISVLGYLLHAPVALLTGSYLALLFAAVVLLARDVRPWRSLLRAPGILAVVAGLWLLLDLWIGVRVGSHVQGDAAFHVARIRMLLQLGLGSWDPLLAGQQFEPIYHTNLYHALIAVSAQLARIDPGAAWVWAWPFAKLMLAAASYELAFRIFGERWLGWCAALTASAWFLTNALLPLPNTLAPFAFMPLGIAFAIESLAEPPRFRHAAWLGAISLVLAQIHMVNAFFLALAIVPALALRLLVAVIRAERGRSERLAALLAIGLALPWLLVPARAQLTSVLGAVAQAQATHAGRSPGPRTEAPARERKASSFVEVRPGLVRMNAQGLVGLDNDNTHTLGALLLLLVFLRRRAVLALVAIVATIAAWLFVPQLCTALMGVLRSNWAVLRFTNTYALLCFSLVPGTVLALLARALEAGALRFGGPLVSARGLARWSRRALELIGCVAALSYASWLGVRTEPWTRDVTRRAAALDTATRKAERVSRRARFFARTIEPGATLMAPLLMDYDLPMHCVCHPLAFRVGRGERGLTDLAARRDAVTTFYARETSAEVRQELVRRFGIRYVYSSPRRAPSLAADLAPRVRATSSERADAILELAP